MPHNYELCFKTPQKRWIYVPTKACREKGKEYIDLIFTKWSPPDFYYHFRSGGHIAAIEVHRRHSFFAKADLSSFFPSISKSKIVRVLKKIGFSYKVSNVIAGWSTVICKEWHSRWILPYGFVQSQLLAALCMDKSEVGYFMRNELSEDVTISVYVDDIILSSNDVESLRVAYARLLAAIDKSSFSLNAGKSHPPQSSTTVFNIDVDSSHIEITAERFDGFMEEVTPEESRKSEAIIAYVSGVNSYQGSLLMDKLRVMTGSP